MAAVDSAHSLEDIFPSWPPPPAGLQQHVQSAMSFEKTPKE